MKRFLYYVLVAATLFVTTPALAKPLYVRTAFGEDAATRFRIAWTSLANAEAQIEYGTKSGIYTQKATGTMDVIGGPLGTTSEVVLTGLQPATTYYYHVGGPKGGWTPEHSFTTGPTPNPQCSSFRFIYAGDSRSEKFLAAGPAPGWMLLLQQALGYTPKPSFLLHGGDIIYSGKDSKLWADFLKKSAPYTDKLPIMFAIGNHDTGPTDGDGANYNRIYSLPRADKALGGSGTEDYYYFTYGNAIIISLSTSTFSEGSPKFKKQADWMDKVLTAHPKRWRFVFMHHPIYTVNLFGLNHPSNEKHQNPAFVPVFNKHHVDIVFQCHDHYYERWVPSACTKADSLDVCPSSGPDTGTTYITSGGAGAFALPWAGVTGPTRPAASGKYHLMRLDVDNEKLTVGVFEVPSGKPIDSFTITKKITGPDPCLGATPDAGLPDTGPAPDAGVADSATPQADSAAPQADSAAPQADTSAPQVDTSAPQADTAATPPSTGSSSGGCDCRVSAAEGLPAALLPFALLLALVLRRRRRRV